MLQRVVRALVCAGGFLVVAGVVYGAVRVGDGCGSGFTPNSGPIVTSSAVECAELVAGRGNQAWMFIVLGLALLAGAFGLSLESTTTGPAAATPPHPAVPAVAPAPPAPSSAPTVRDEEPNDRK
ncbi:hypothetical protein AB0442_21215 [Kitasatospora sp. NPDC085895]|uniref:hypothetical protein n=1 Tax=Kitasatospora sp. NPDC085895 TaxID=3155057 RepID=UPI00344D5DA2